MAQNFIDEEVAQPHPLVIVQFIFSQNENVVTGQSLQHIFVNFIELVGKMYHFLLNFRH